MLYEFTISLPEAAFPYGTPEKAAIWVQITTLEGVEVTYQRITCEVDASSVSGSFELAEGDYLRKATAVSASDSAIGQAEVVPFVVRPPVIRRVPAQPN